MSPTPMRVSLTLRLAGPTESITPRLALTLGLEFGFLNLSLELLDGELAAT